MKLIYVAFCTLVLISCNSRTVSETKITNKHTILDPNPVTSQPALVVLEQVTVEVALLKQDGTFSEPESRPINNQVLISRPAYDTYTSAIEVLEAMKATEDGRAVLLRTLESR